MRLTIEIVAAALLVVCISATSAAFAAGKAGKSADGLGCSYSVAQGASPAARCAALKRQCGGKFHANYCGDKLLSASDAVSKAWSLLSRVATMACACSIASTASSTSKRSWVAFVGSIVRSVAATSRGRNL